MCYHCQKPRTQTEFVVQITVFFILVVLLGWLASAPVFWRESYRAQCIALSCAFDNDSAIHDKWCNYSNRMAVYSTWAPFVYGDPKEVALDAWSKAKLEKAQ